MSDDTLINAIDDVLPQTQCGLCGYGGCRPYAQAMVIKQENINKCTPGGLTTLMTLASLTGQDATPFIADMQQKAKLPSRAVIRESECIGCTKCIQACPVDAIVGAAKQMHTIIAQECTGCELCIEPCPVDCIDIVPMPVLPDPIQRAKSVLARQRYSARNNRLQAPAPTIPTADSNEEKINLRKAAIEEALARARLRKNEC